MSQLKVQGNPLGTGSVTIAAPNTNTDRTLSLPDESGTLLTTATPGVPVNGPAFSVYTNSALTLTSSYTRYKVNLNLEVFDTNSSFDTSNYRFLPLVAGYYLITASAAITATNPSRSYIYKNGSVAAGGAVQPPSTGFGGAPSPVSYVLYLNGSTDYVELYVESSSASQTLDTTASSTYLTGALVRAA